MPRRSQRLAGQVSSCRSACGLEQSRPMVETPFAYVVRNWRETRAPMPARPQWPTKLIFAGTSVRGWLLPIFVLALCTNLVGTSPVRAADAPLTPIPKISKLLIKQEIIVRAPITAIREPSSGAAPYIVSLAEGGTTLPMVYWSDLQPGVTSKVKIGNVIQAKVTVSVYRDQLELRLRSAADLELASEASLPSTSSTTTNTAGAMATSVATSPTPVAASPTPTASAPPLSTTTVIGKIKADWSGRVVTISATISGFQDTPQGRQFTVDDATGEIPMLLGEKVLGGLSVSQLQPGQALTVTGAIALSDGKPIIVPEDASAVKLATQ
jgi:hypothetical protein